jgi:hypothetical protein
VPNRQRSHHCGPGASGPALDVLVHIPDVDVHAGRDAPAAQPERDELPASALAAQADLISLWRVSGVLHPDVIVLETHGVRSELDQQAADRVPVQCLRHGL